MKAEIRGAALVVVGAVIALVFVAVLDDPPAAATPDQPSAEGWVEVVAALERLNESLERSQPIQAPTSTRQPSPPSSDSQTPDLGELTATLGSLASALRSGNASGNTPGIDPLLRDRPTDSVSVRQFHSMLRAADKAEAKRLRRSMLLTSCDELLSRFGRPQEVGLYAEGKELWRYPFQDGTLEFEISPNGYVIKVHD